MNLFISGSTKENIEPLYFKDCCKLVSELAKIEGVNLVFDGYYTGLMGRCYEEFRNNNKKIIRVMTKYQNNFVQEDVSYERKIIVNTTMEVFEKVYKNSDIVLFLPGGLGTYARFFSAIEEGRNEKGKKIILYNDNYFYTPIIKELYKLYENGFIDYRPASYMTIESDINKIIEMIEEEID